MMKREDYTIGWICALGNSELPAAEAMLDNEHPPLPGVGGDSMIYRLGDIAGHNIVIGCLPAGRYGTNPAAVAAQNMQRTFTSLRFGLMVGIGGGLPSQQHDIRLGDVVVSEPNERYGGVVQYDLGKALRGGRVELKGQLDAPPTALLYAVSILKSRYRRKDPELIIHLTKMLAENPKMQADFAYQGVEHDILYEYQEGETVETNPESRVKRRPPRGSDPVVHYGLIATGNKVIKDHEEALKVKNDILSSADVLCFEMEAAGLMNDFPCIVIRGISDYADGYKNDRWQGYAAATAAAYAKELVGVIPLPEAAVGDGEAGSDSRKGQQRSLTQGSNQFGNTHAVGSRIMQGTFNNSNIQ